LREGYSVPKAPIPRGARDRRVAALALALLLVFLGIALAKPWGAPAVAPPVATVRSTEVPGILTASGGPTAAPVARRPPPTAAPVPLPVAFTLPVAPAPSASWRGLEWRRLAPDDPLTIVASVNRWRDGFVAIGRSDAERAFTPMWTSPDGADWDPLQFDTSRTFWPGSLLIGVAAVPSGLVALTETTDCGTAPCVVTDEAVVTAWTSSDGRRWTPHALPGPIRLSGGGLQVAGGPAGVVVASSGGLGARVAISTDGIVWQARAASALPAGFLLNDLQGTGAGYVAAGLQVTGDTHWDAAALWSPDGRRWSSMPMLLPSPPASASGPGSSITSVSAGRDGLIAVGRNLTVPGGALWWQSPDGQHWTALPTFQPLGTVNCSRQGCGPEPNGWLVGDGERLIAGRGGPDASAWVSPDGISWQPISMSGDIPGEGATVATLLPGGVLLTDGSRTWLGEPVVR
jgi:hypothetical protein